MQLKIDSFLLCFNSICANCYFALHCLNKWRFWIYAQTQTQTQHTLYTLLSNTLKIESSTQLTFDYSVLKTITKLENYLRRKTVNDNRNSSTIINQLAPSIIELNSKRYNKNYTIHSILCLTISVYLFLKISKTLVKCV